MRAAERPFDFYASWGFSPIPGATVTWVTQFNTISTSPVTLSPSGCTPYSADVGVSAVGIAQGQSGFDDSGTLIIYALCHEPLNKLAPFDLGLVEYQGGFPLAGTGTLREYFVAGKLVTSRRSAFVTGILYDLEINSELPAELDLHFISFCPINEYDDLSQARDEVNSVCDALTGAVEKLATASLQATFVETEAGSLEREVVNDFDDPDEDSCWDDFQGKMSAIARKYADVRKQIQRDYEDAVAAAKDAREAESPLSNILNGVAAGAAAGGAIGAVGGVMCGGPAGAAVGGAIGGVAGAVGGGLGAWNSSREATKQRYFTQLRSAGDKRRRDLDRAREDQRLEEDQAGVELIDCLLGP